MEPIGDALPPPVGGDVEALEPLGPNERDPNDLAVNLGDDDRRRWILERIHPTLVHAARGKG